MINPITPVNVPAFASSGSRVEPDGITYANGYVSPVELPAEHLNWFLAGLTANGVSEQTALNAVITELDNVVTGTGGTLDGAGSSQVLKAITGGYVALTTGSSPYALAAFGPPALIISATTNPYIVNLPQASTCIGYQIAIVNGSALATGLIRVHPFAGDAIGSAGSNVDCYLQNVDEGGFVYQFQFISLRAEAAGYWAVVGGQFCPHQTTDADGSHYHLGKLHHLPLADTVSRGGGHAPVAGWSSALTGWSPGSTGVPNGAKAIRARVMVFAYAAAAGQVQLQISWSDNNSNSPTQNTAHPMGQAQGYAAATGNLISNTCEVDIPLNSIGKFYEALIIAVNVTLASCSVGITPVGYYMGD